MVSAEEFGRSFRGTSALVGRRADALAAFDLTARGFWRSFLAFPLTAPAYIVSLALERRELGLDLATPALFADPGLALLVAAGHVAGFLALPLAIGVVLRRTAFAPGYVPFVVVTNWIAIFGALALAFPSALFLIGLETAALTALITTAFAVILLQAQWFAAKVTLGVGSGTALAITALGLLLDLGLSGLFRFLVA